MPKKKKKKKKRKSTSDSRAIGIIVFGPPGVGKTAFAGHFKNVGFITDPQEQGILDLVEYKQAPQPKKIWEVDNWEDLLETTDKVVRSGIETLAVDSLTGIEKICFAHHCREHFEDDWSSKGFYAYQSGPKNAAKTDWPDWMDLLSEVRKAGIHVILLAHSQIKNYNNPEGADYDRYIPYLDKEIWSAAHRWSQAVIFYNYKIVVRKEKGATKTKADLEQSEGRFLYTEWTPAYEAKNRLGLEPIIDAGENGKEAAKAFLHAVKKARA